MKKFTTLLFAMLALMLGQQTVQAEDEDAKKIQGTWVVESAKRGGEDFEAPVGDKLKLDGDKMEIVPKDGNGPPPGKFKLDATKSPKHFTMIVMIGDAERELTAVYAFDGEKLKLCMPPPGMDRPEKVESTEGSATVLLILKREKE